MEYKFFTDDEANYISEILNRTNTIKKNNFEKEFYNLHYDELVNGRRGEEWIKDAEKKKDLTDNQFLKIKVNALNYGIGCLNYFNDNDIDNRKDTLLGVIKNRYKDDESYIKLLSYILLSSSPKRIDNIETLNLFIDDLIGILNDKDIKKYYIENYDYRKGEELKEKEDKERKIKIDSVIDSIIKENKKYKLNEFVRDIFSDTINTLKIEGKIVPLSNQEAIDVFEIWSESIKSDEDFYCITHKIKKYCDKIEKDYIMALYSLYIKNQFYYYCRYTNHKAYYDLDIKVGYFERIYLMNFLRLRIKDKYTGEINAIPDIEDNIANMLNLLDDNTNNTNKLFDITTATKQNFKAFHNIHIDIVFKYNNYTYLLENLIKKEIVNKGKEESNTDIRQASKKREVLNPICEEAELIRIFNELVKQKYISCDLNLFLSCFGCKEDENNDKIIWKSTYVQFEIFISEMVQKEKNSVNYTLGLPRKKINLWFVDKKKKEINVTKTIPNALKTYPIYKLIYP